MLDIKRIRTDFDAVAKKLATRGVDAAILNEMKEIDAKRRDILVKVENLKAERNTVSAEIAQAKRNKENADDKIAAMQTLSAEVKALDTELAEIDAKLTEFTTTLPNIPADSVPVGADEDDNVEVRRWGTPREFGFEPKAHWDLGEDLDILDWESTTSCWTNMARKATLKSSLLTWLTMILCLVLDSIQNSRKILLNLAIPTMF